MAGKVKVQPVSRVGLEPLVEIAEHLRAELPGWADTAPPAGRQRIASDLARDLGHLSRHDGDGFLTASINDEVIGFGISYVRSRLLTIAQLWLLPDYRDQKIAEQLIRRMLAFGERSGAADAVVNVLGGPSEQALFFHFGFRPRFPIYRLVLEAERARHTGGELLKLLAGTELTETLLQRRVGSGDLQRLDKLVRGFMRPMDHEYWLSERDLRLATVREGQRLAAYAYGGEGQCGPVAAATPEAALAGLGWALRLAAESGGDEVQAFIPAPFEAGIEHLLDAGAVCRAASQWMTRSPAGAAMERYVMPGITLL